MQTVQYPVLLSWTKATQTGTTTTHESTNQGKSSKMGLVLVLNMAIIAGRSAACGSPERTVKTETEMSY